jgi:chemosensory pili system protein ChpC
MSNTDVQTPTQSAPAASIRTANDIRGMLLQVQDKLLLLPGVSVAEIVNYSQPECPDGAPDWFLGYMVWRKLAVPLLSFELLNGQAVTASTETPRIAVLNNTGVNEALPFVAIVIQGIPRLVRILPKDISEAEDISLSPAELAAMRLVTGETVMVPDVSVLEKAVGQYLQVS